MATLSFIIEAQNRATDTIKQVESQLSGMEKKTKSMEPAFKKMAAAGTVAFGAISAGVYSMTQSASDAQEIFNKFDVVFADVSDEAEKVAQDLRNNFGLAESSAKKLLSSTGDMLTGFGLSGKAALDLAEKTNKLAVDLASFTNIEGGAERASQALTKALLGERESVKELGIAILEEDVKAKVEAMKAAGAFTDETERQMRAMATLEIAIEQSKNAIGDYARTQDSLANKQRELEQRTIELKETIGVAFIPVLQELVNKIEPVIANISEWIRENPELTRNITLATMAITGIIAVVGTLGLLLPSLIAGFGAFGAILTFITSPVGLVVAAIAGLIAIGVALWKNWDEISEKAGEIWGNIQDTISSVIGHLKGLIGEFVNWFQDKFDFIGDTISRVKDAIGSIGSLVGGAVSSATGAVSSFFGGYQFGTDNVPRTGMYMLHKGESVYPAGLSSGGGSIVVNINGGYYMSERAAEDMGDKIIERLKREVKL